MRSKYFEELSTNELYEILRARAEIFVVEQNCVYQDLDGIDYESLHVFAEEGGKVTASSPPTTFGAPRSEVAASAEVP